MVFGRFVTGKTDRDIFFCNIISRNILFELQMQTLQTSGQSSSRRDVGFR